MMETDLDALIVGAGPTGLVLAAELARRGVSCRVIDRAGAPAETSRAIGIQARTLELFEHMGIVDQFVERGIHGHAVNVHADSHRIARLDFRELESAFPYILSVPQSETERLLGEYANAQGVTIERSVEFRHMTQDSDGVTADLHHLRTDRTEHINARWIFGCDGAHSTVRQALDIPFAGKTYPLHFVLADLVVHWALPDDEFQIFIAPDGLVAIFPLPNRRYRLIADNPPANIGDGAPTLELCKQLFAARVHESGYLSDLSWSSNFRIHSRIAQCLQLGRGFLVGDAAHIHSPAGAQGMNTGIQDAYNLAWKVALVAAGVARPSLLDTYHIERYPVEEAVLRQTDWLTRIATADNLVTRYVRDALASFATNMGFVQERIRSTIAELDITYAGSPIVEEHSVPGGVAAGARAPDPLLARTPDGSLQRLYTLLDPLKHALLVFRNGDTDAATSIRIAMIAKDVQDRYSDYIDVHVVVRPTFSTDDTWNVSTLYDVDQSAESDYGSRAPTMYLIRPDGYIAFRSDLSDDGRMLNAYLSRVFLL
jgi:2-polyprenyl-6-methoxyphenol hydroxylase-like FAD-dependent oxidoreductase